MSYKLDNTYKAVAASQTASPFGTHGDGDFVSHVLITPATTSPGAVTLIDGASSFTVFAGGASSVADMRPFLVPVLAYALTGPWKVTTGANVSAVIVGSINKD